MDEHTNYCLHYEFAAVAVMLRHYMMNDEIR